MGTDIHGVFQAHKDGKWTDVPSEYEQDRHYLLFAWLGNVRNGFGFAGCKTHTPITPLTDCRGLPEDFHMEGDSHPVSSIEILDPRRRKWHEEDEPLEIWMGDHSHSYVLGEEVLGAELPVITRNGIVDRALFEKWDGESAPEDWCGGISGPSIKIDTPDTVDEDTSHVQLTWLERTSESLSYFIDEVQRLMNEYGDIRFVFGFDS